MPFECQQCGECCSHLGLVHSILEDRGNHTYVVHNRYTNEKDVVTVDPDKFTIFEDRSIFLTLPEACPFFRHQPGSELAYCTVHLTRPEICRDYGCWRMLILDERGRRVGRIMFSRYLCTDDESLKRIFEQCIDPIQESDDAVWDNHVIRILSRSNYTVRT